MSLTPDEIAAKEFLVGLRGYDKDEVRAFLRMVATSVEEHSAAAAVVPEPAPLPDPAPEPDPLPIRDYSPSPAPAAAPSSEWADLGEEIAAVLRTAHEQAAGLKAEAEAEADAIRARAEQDAAHLRAEAEQDRAAADTKLAKAQDEALALVAEAQTRVATMIETSRAKAEAEARNGVQQLTAQVEELTGARDAARSHLRDLKHRIDKALNTAERDPGDDDD
jgi:DivIVA domain-containing protein